MKLELVHPRVARDDEGRTWIRTDDGRWLMSPQRSQENGHLPTPAEAAAT